MVGLSVLMPFAGAWLSLSLFSSGVSLYLMSDGESAVEPMFAKRRERLCIETEEKGSNTEISRRVSYYIPLPNPTLTLFPPLSPSFLCVTLDPLSAEGSSWYQEDYSMGSEWTALDPFLSL